MPEIRLEEFHMDILCGFKYHGDVVSLLQQEKRIQLLILRVAPYHYKYFVSL